MAEIMESIIFIDYEYTKTLENYLYFGNKYIETQNFVRQGHYLLN